MSACAPGAQWLHALRARADLPPLRPRVPLWWGASAIGSVEADFPDRFALPALESGGPLLVRAQRGGMPGWRVQGDLTVSLALFAAALRDAGLAGAWRDEQLAVMDEQGVRLGTVERAAVRPLGIATFAVHLAGRSPQGLHWVQQRALTKPNDPGLWDTLMGGMVGAADTLESALARETWEEAGLRPPGLEGLRWGGRILTRRPSHDGGCAGWLEEAIDWFVCTVPIGCTPKNQDGEVAQFALLEPQDLMERLQRWEFTLEASLVLTAAGI